MTEEEPITFTQLAESVGMTAGEVKSILERAGIDTRPLMTKRIKPKAAEGLRKILTEHQTRPGRKIQTR